MAKRKNSSPGAQLNALRKEHRGGKPASCECGLVTCKTCMRREFKRASRIRIVPCPKCGAPPKKPCVINGKAVRTRHGKPFYHLDREVSFKNQMRHLEANVQFVKE